jgi:hypothetical protein
MQRDCELNFRSSLGVHFQKNALFWAHKEINAQSTNQMLAWWPFYCNASKELELVCLENKCCTVCFLSSEVLHTALSR